MTDRAHSSIDDAGAVLAAWAFEQVRRREIVSRPWFIGADGEKHGETLYFDPASIQPKLRIGDSD